MNDLIESFAAEAATEVVLVRHKRGSYRDGVFNRVIESRKRITALVSPVTGEDALALPAGLTRSTSLVEVRSAEPILADDQKTGRPADRLEINGTTYVVDSVKHWEFGELTHYEAMAMRAAT